MDYVVPITEDDLVFIQNLDVLEQYPWICIDSYF